METAPRILLSPTFDGGPYRGGITAREGFPAVDPTAPEDLGPRVAGRALLAEALAVDARRLCWLQQVHGPAVRGIEAAGDQGEADALVSDDPRWVLLVSVADCGPVLLADPEAGVHAAAHAGWRGIVAGVLEATVEAMVIRGADPARLRAWVGPCISAEHFEVGPEVAAHFEDAVLRPAPHQGSRPHVDLKEAMRRRLRAVGIHDDAIEVSAHCTYGEPELFWSYRRDAGISGRHLAFLHGRLA